MKTSLSLFGIEDEIKQWLKEDIGSGDITTLATVPAGSTTRAIIHAKKPGILAGVDLAREVFHALDPSLKFTAILEDGAEMDATSVIATVEGDAQAILTGERSPSTSCSISQASPHAPTNWQSSSSPTAPSWWTHARPRRACADWRNTPCA